MAQLQLLFPVVGFVMSLIITLACIPFLIKLSNKKHLFDEPSQRKQHGASTPTMGGIAIFIGLFISINLLVVPEHLPSIRFLSAGLVVLLATGVYDDLMDVRASKKMLLQMLAGFCVFIGGVRVDHLYGFLGIEALPLVVSFGLTILVITLLINAFNLIDGVDGLAGSLGLFTFTVFGGAFMYFGAYDLATISFAMSGALLGFLYFNWNPAKIFMGDTGSMLLGFMSSILAIQLFEVSITSGLLSADPSTIPALIAVIVFLPVFDMMRVMCVRIRSGRSPFSADRNHIHHIFLKQGFQPKQICGILIGSSTFFLLTVFQLQTLGWVNLVLLFFLAGTGTALLSNYPTLRQVFNKQKMTIQIRRFSKQVLGSSFF